MSEKLFKGGSFLTQDFTGEDVLTPEDCTDEHKMIAKTTEDFEVKEVVPLIDNLENHEFEHSGDLLRKAGELGLLSADIPAEYSGLKLDRISSSLITEQICGAGGFSITHVAHVGIDPLPIVNSDNEEHKQGELRTLA